MRPKSFVYVSKDIAVYLSQTNHSLAFKDGFKVHNIEDLVIGAEAYIYITERGIPYRVCVLYRAKVYLWDSNNGS